MFSKTKNSILFILILIVVSSGHLYLLHIEHKRVVPQKVVKKSVVEHRVTLSQYSVKEPAPPPPPPMPKKIEKKPKKVIKKPKKKRVIPKKVVKPKPKKVEVVKAVKEQEVQKPKEEIKEVVEKPTPTPPKTTKRVEAVVDSEAIKREYIAYLQREISRSLQYPRGARRRGVEGVVTVSFQLLRDGSISDIEILSSSNSILSRGAIKTLNILSLRDLPKELSQPIVFKVPIEFKLR
jgi:protein TonB